MTAVIAVPLVEAMMSADLEANKAVVVAFYNQMLNDKDAEGAAASYLGEQYVQHNPSAPDGAAGMVGFAQALYAKAPELRMEIKRVFADGDYVITHSHTVFAPGGPETAAADIWRLENGKIVEHWDVIQPIPATAANSNTMF